MSVGDDVPRLDGLAKLSGAARYVDDLVMPGMLHGGTVRSAVARGRIKAIHFDSTVDWSTFVIVDHRDITGYTLTPALSLEGRGRKNEVQLIDVDQPALAAGQVRHRFEPIVLLAHGSMAELRRGLRGVRVEYDELPAVFDVEAAVTPDVAQYHSDNVFKRIEMLKGDAASQFAGAAHVIEGEYRTGSQEHVYLETQGMIACVEGDGGDGDGSARMVVKGTMQCPYYVLKSLTHLFGRPESAFRVVQTPTGGGFGGKEDYPSIIAIHAALLAEKSGRPVKMIYGREEDMAATTKRHPCRVRHRTAVNRDGKLLAMEIDVLMDGGAYCTLSPVVLSRGVIHAAGPYACEHVRVVGEARLTNSPPNGAFRGFGAPQTLFAIERHMDVIAARIGMDPVELRRRNLLRDGQATATGQIVRDGVDLTALQERALSYAKYAERRERHASENASHPYLRRGIGFATFLHGAGFTGSGETYLASEVWVEGMPDGRVRILTANTDMGQGTETILTQVAADHLGLVVSQVEYATPDTSQVPNSGPTVASRTAMVVGRLIERACDDLLEQCGTKDARGAKVSAAIVGWHTRGKPKAESRKPKKENGSRLLGRAKYARPETIVWDDKTYRGDAYACYSWATYVAEVEVDLRTFGVRVTDFVALQEVGKVLNPTLARGQIAGGVVQGIGWSLMEEVVTERGAMRNSQLTNYIIPTSGDLPPIRVCFEERPSAFGPHGAKGIGELPMDGPGPAIANAVSNALGRQFCELPLTPERIMTVMESAK